MINYLPELYSDEILYSWFSRYTNSSGYTGSRTSSQDMFGISSSLGNVHYPKQLDYFANQLPKELGIDFNYLLSRHTIIPLYLPFLDKRNQEIIIESISGGESRRLRGVMGLYANNLFYEKFQHFKVCPKCIEESISNDKEVYLDRTHQIPGNLVCTKHWLYLEKIYIPSKLSRLAYYDFSGIYPDSIEQVPVEDELKPWFQGLYDDIRFVIDGGLKHYDLEWLKERYWEALKRNNHPYTTKIKQQQLYQDFIDYYPMSFLQKLESVPTDNKSSWLLEITNQNPNRVHVVRHLLFIRFLFGGAFEILKYCKEEANPFGEGPWSCLNPVCKDFQKPVIKEVEIEYRHPFNDPLGIFKCNCGFTYVSRLSKYSANMSYKRIKVRCRGEVWYNKLQTLVSEGSNSITKIADEMCCYRNVVIKNATSMGLLDRLNTSQELSYSKKGFSVTYEQLDEYKNRILEYIQANPNALSTEVKMALSKECGLLAKRDKEWLKNNLPKSTINISGLTRADKIIDWEARDEEVARKLLEEIELMKSETLDKKIARTALANRLGYYGLLQSKNSLRMPKSFEVIKEYCKND